MTKEATLGAAAAIERARAKTASAKASVDQRLRHSRTPWHDVRDLEVMALCEALESVAEVLAATLDALEKLEATR